MQMNGFETWLMDTWARRAVQRHHAAPLMRRLGGGATAGRALEIGCGHGHGIPIVFDVFGATHVDGFDLDPALVAAAQQRIARYGERARVWVGDAERLEAADGTYDSVFAFGVLHHLPDWRRGLAEVARVVKPGGIFFAEESYAGFITHPFWRRLMDHPQTDRFDHASFRIAMEAAGFSELGESLALGSGTGWVVGRKR